MSVADLAAQAHDVLANGLMRNTDLGRDVFVGVSQREFGVNLALSRREAGSAGNGGAAGLKKFCDERVDGVVLPARRLLGGEAGEEAEFFCAAHGRQVKNVHSHGREWRAGKGACFCPARRVARARRRGVAGDDFSRGIHNPRGTGEALEQFGKLRQGGCAFFGGHGKGSRAPLPMPDFLSSGIGGVPNKKGRISDTST